VKRFLLIVISFVLLAGFCRGQKLKFPRQHEFKWPDSNVRFPEIPDSLLKEDIVIISDEITYDNGELIRRVVYKLLTEEGIRKISKVQLPETFDLARFPNKLKQGRFKDRGVPYCQKFDLFYFGARIIRKNQIINEGFFDLDVSKSLWLKKDGSHEEQNKYTFNFKTLEVNDILEYTYCAGQTLRPMIIHLSAEYPRLKLTLNTPYSFGFYNTRPKDTLILKKPIKNKESMTYVFHGIRPVNYPLNSMPWETQPHLVFSDFRMKWFFAQDTVEKKKYNTREQIYFRKFVDQFNRGDSDSTGNLLMGAIVDSLNRLHYVSAESMHYSGESQYALTSSEWLFKGKLIEEFLLKSYDNILEDKKIFHYSAIMGDKRYKKVVPEYASHWFNILNIIAIPEGNSIVFYRTRVNGVKYFQNELPFYYENNFCILAPRNTQYLKNKEMAGKIGFITTPKSSFNDNSRSESASIKVLTDSSKIAISIKENLAGQFSTLIRHLYNNDYIDSTVAPNYFQKCTDKPKAEMVKIKKSSGAKTFPFKHSYICTETIPLVSKNEIDLKNWFSFFWDKNSFPKTPNHDFYLDFQFTDTYNYLFEFDKAVEVTNAEGFTQKLSNEFFEISSNLVKQDANKYLLSVVIKVKQEKLQVEHGAKLLEFTGLLDQLNNSKLSYRIL
jgi:hypothetical protein